MCIFFIMHNFEIISGIIYNPAFKLLKLLHINTFKMDKNMIYYRFNENYLTL